MNARNPHPAAPLTFFAMPLPNELLYSVVARNHYLSANLDCRVTIASLFGSREAYVSGEFPARLQIFCERTGMSIDTLLRENTILHVFRPFIDPARIARAIAMMTSDSTRNITHALGIQAGLLHFPNLHRFCPQCAEEDQDQFGTTYLHTEHHLPGVYVCARHACTLVGAPRSRKRLLRFIEGEPLAPSNMISPLLRISRWCEVCFQGKHYIDPHMRITACRQALTARDFLTAAGNLRSTALTAAMKQYWGSLLTFDPFVLLTEWIERNQYRSLIYKPRQQFHPIKHIMLLDFLFGSWCKFERALQPNDTPEQPIIATASSAPSCVLDRDAYVVDLLHQQNGVLRKVAAITRLSVATIKSIALRNGLQIDRRPKKIFAQMTQAILRKLGQGMDAQKIARQHKVSIGAVEQILRSSPAMVLQRKELREIRNQQFHRTQWEILCAKNPQAGRKLLRSKLPGSYAWLYRHDGDWLEKHLPARRPAHRPKRAKL